MSENRAENKIRREAMYRRWGYMVIAIVAAYMISLGPVFSFDEGDKGTFSTRTHSMDQKEFRVTQIVLDTLNEEEKQSKPAQEVKDRISVMGLYVLQKIIFWACIVCLICFYPTRLRWYLSLCVIGISALYYVFLLYYYNQIVDIAFATLRPTWVAIMPAVIIVAMTMVNRNVARYGNYFDDIKDD